MYDIVGQNLGNFIKEFMEYDDKNNANYLCFFMRICVLMDVHNPIKKSKKIKGRRRSEWSFFFFFFFSSMNAWDLTANCVN